MTVLSDEGKTDSREMENLIVNLPQTALYCRSRTCGKHVRHIL